MEQAIFLDERAFSCAVESHADELTRLQQSSPVIKLGTASAQAYSPTQKRIPHRCRSFYKAFMSSQSASKVLIPATAVACVSQLIWFGSKVIGQIDYDGMAYAGIAEQIRHWHLRDSLNAFRSPLISWLIAMVPRMTVLHAGKLITISTFLLTLVLLYAF